MAFDLEKNYIPHLSSPTQLKTSEPYMPNFVTNVSPLKKSEISSTQQGLINTAIDKLHQQNILFYYDIWTPEMLKAYEYGFNEVDDLFKSKIENLIKAFRFANFSINEYSIEKLEIMKKKYPDLKDLEARDEDPKIRIQRKNEIEALLSPETIRNINKLFDTSVPAYVKRIRYGEVIDIKRISEDDEGLVWNTPELTAYLIGLIASLHINYTTQQQQ